MVLENLAEAGFMNEGQVFGARQRTATRRPDDARPNYHYYVDWAFEETKRLVNALPRSLVGRTLVVRTALDMNVQRSTEGVVESALRQYGRE